MNKRILITTIIIIILIVLFSLIFFNVPDTQGYALLVETIDPYPSEYLPISEWELLAMPTLLRSMNETGIQKTITQEEWEKIKEFLEAEQGNIKFYNEFYSVKLLREL